MEEAIVLIIIFGTLFGISYLHYSTRHKERLALIEKGVDASIFVRSKKGIAGQTWKIFIVSIALLSIGIGLGIFLAGILHHSIGLDEEIAFPGAIFTMAGLGLFTGFKVTNNLLDKE